MTVDREFVHELDDITITEAGIGLMCSPLSRFPRLE